MKNLMFLFLVMSFTISGINARTTNTYALNPPTIATDTTTLVEYKGKYNFENGAPVSDVTVVIEEDALWAKSDQGSFLLKPVDKKADNFTIEAIDAEVVFTRNEQKKIIGMSVKMPDGTIVAKKEDAK
jgi:hypothetical protein